MKFLVLLAAVGYASAASSNAVTCEECQAGAAALVDRLLSEASLTEQGEILKALVCPQTDDPASCEAAVDMWFGDMATCIYNHFVLEADVCSRLGLTKKDKHKKKKNKKKIGKKGNKSSKHAKKERSDNEKKSNKKAHKTAEEKRKANKKAAEKKDTPKITMKDMRDAKTLGSLAGIASLRRSGDVVVQDVEDHKVITSTFTVGPLSLEVSKTYKNGKSKSVRTAKAVTEVMYGTMQLKVKLDGSAHVKKVVFKNPESVEVAGSVTDSRQRSDTYLRNSVKRMRPLAAQKILKTARYVLRAPSAVRRN